VLSLFLRIFLHAKIVTEGWLAVHRLHGMVS
jgi:hypothetical protein